MHLGWPFGDLVVVVLSVELPCTAVCQVVLTLELGEDGLEVGRLHKLQRQVRHAAPSRQPLALVDPFAMLRLARLQQQRHILAQHVERTRTRLDPRWVKAKEDAHLI